MWLRNRLDRTHDWTCPTEQVLRLYGTCAREAAHPTTSSGTGRQRQQDYCVVYLSARNRALVTIWEDWTARVDVEGRRKPGGTLQLEARYLSAPVCPAGSVQQEHWLPRAR